MWAHLEYISGGTILIVDEDVDISLLLKVYFLRKQWKVSVAHTVADALERTTEVMPTAIIFLSYATKSVVDDFVEKVPGVQLIICDGQTVYQK